MQRARLLCWAVAALLSAGNAAGQPDRFVITAFNTHPVLTSLQILPDGTVLYADAYGNYRTRNGQTQTLLSNPVGGGYCEVTMFGMCVLWVPPVYHIKPMAADSHGTVYIADPEQHLIERYDEASGAFVPVLSAAGSPTTLAATGDGDIYFNDPAGCRVLRYLQGSLSIVAGTGTCGYSNDGGPATSAEILSISAITLDSAGQLYIADSVAGVVRRVDTCGTIMTIVGTGMPGEGADGAPANQTPLNGPAGLAFDAQGNLYIAEDKGNRVRMLGADGLVRTIAGTGTAGYAGDYGLALAAQLTAPGCLAGSPSGTLEVCDTERVRELIPVLPDRWVIPVLGASQVSRFAPGSWMMLLGDFPGVPTMDWGNAIGPDGKLPVSLGGVMASTDGEPCVIAYVSPNRIDLLLPADLDPGSKALTLALPGGARSTFPLTITPASPGFLAIAQNGRLYAAALSSSGTWITPGQPAHPGDIVKLYVTGLKVTGPIAPPYDATWPDAMQVVLSSLGLPVILAQPFSPGVTEVTFQIPAATAQGQLPVLVFSSGFLSVLAAFLPVD